MDKAILKEIVSAIEDNKVESDNLLDNSFYTIKDTWQKHIHNIIVEKDNYAYSIDAFNDGEVFGNRALIDSDYYNKEFKESYYNDDYKIVNL